MTVRGLSMRAEPGNAFAAYIVDGKRFLFMSDALRRALYRRPGVAIAPVAEPPAIVNPPLDHWVLAHWPHMARSQCNPTGQRGWFHSRLTDRGWQAQFGSDRTLLRNSKPSAWKELER